jgi:hypothetical protein
MKHVCSFILLFLGCISTTLAANPYNADIVVAKDGTGDFTLLQAAIDAAPSESSRRTVIYIKRGKYDTEKVIIPAEKKNLTFIGESRDETIISYHLYNCTGGICPTEDATKWTGENINTSATLTILGNGFRAENLTIETRLVPSVRHWPSLCAQIRSSLSIATSMGIRIPFICGVMPTELISKVVLLPVVQTISMVLGRLFLNPVRSAVLEEDGLQLLLQGLMNRMGMCLTIAV